MAEVDPRIGRAAASQVDQRAQRDVQVEVAAVFLVTDADSVLRPQEVEQALQTTGERRMFGEQSVDQRGVARRMQRFVEADPVGPVTAGSVIPLRVVARRQSVDLAWRLHRPERVEQFLVVTQLVIAPKVAVVVTVVDQRVGEMDVGQLVALPARPCDVGERQGSHRLAARFTASHRLCETGDERVQVGVAVAMCRIEQGAREHRQAVAQTASSRRVAGALDGLRMEGEKAAPQTRVAADDQRFDAAVLEDLDRQTLLRAIVVGEHRPAPAAMTGHVRQGRPVAVDSAHTARVVERIRQTDAVGVVIRYGGHGGGQGCCPSCRRGRRQTRRIGDKRRVVAPQGAQDKVEQTFVIDQQRAVSLALKDSATVGRLQAEVGALAFRVVGVVAHTVVDPVAQAADRQAGEQAGRLGQEIGQAGTGVGLMDAVYRSGCALHQVDRQVEVVLHLFRRGKSARDGGERLQKGSNRPAIRRTGQGLQRMAHGRQRRFANDAGNRRPFGEKNQQRLDTAPHVSQEAPAFEVGTYPIRRKNGQRGVQAVREDVVDLREATVELRAADGQTLLPGTVPACVGDHAERVRRKRRRSRDRAPRARRGRR